VPLSTAASRFGTNVNYQIGDGIGMLSLLVLARA
jgi:hypothetical protein